MEEAVSVPGGSADRAAGAQRLKIKSSVFSRLGVLLFCGYVFFLSFGFFDFSPVAGTAAVVVGSLFLWWGVKFQLAALVVGGDGVVARRGHLHLRRQSYGRARLEVDDGGWFNGWRPSLVTAAGTRVVFNELGSRNRSKVEQRCVAANELMGLGDAGQSTAEA